MKQRILHLFILILCSSRMYAQWEQSGERIIGSEPFQNLGFSIQLNAAGNIKIIGSPGTNGRTGSASVYRLEDDNWIQLGNTINGDDIGDETGFAVDISADGQIIVVGSPGFDDDSGKAEVFEYDEAGDQWDAILEVDGTFLDAQLGYSVALNSEGNYLTVGAPFADYDGIDRAGIILNYYTNDDASWESRPIYSGTSENDYLGASISVSDNNYIAVGAPGASYVTVLAWSDVSEDWYVIGDDLSAIEGDPGTLYGNAVSLNASGNTLAIGAPAHGDGPLIASGEIEIREWDGTLWQLKGSPINGEFMDDYYGRSVELSSDGNRFIMGARRDLIGDGLPTEGLARVYDFDGLDWSPLGEDFISESIGDGLGSAVSISSNGINIALGIPNFSDVLFLIGQSVVYQITGGAAYTSIPDPNFEQALIDQGIDSEEILDGRVLTADVSSIITLDVSNSMISDLTGIEDFTSLEILDVSNNLLLHFDLNENNSLRILDCSNNEINHLDLLQNPLLEQVYSQNNVISTLWISGVSPLVELNCSNNQLEMLNVLPFSELVLLDCGDNLLTEINLSNNSLLRHLNIQNNNIGGELSFGDNLLLEAIDCSNTSISWIDVSMLDNLEQLDCSFNQMSELDLTENTALRILDCSENHLEELNLLNNNALTELNVGNNLLTSLNLRFATELTSLVASNNDLEKINLRDMPALEQVDLLGNDQLNCVGVNNIDQAASGLGQYANWMVADPGVYSNSCFFIREYDEVILENTIGLYPNPAIEELNILSNEKTKVIQTVIYNEQGNKVLVSSSSKIDVGFLNSGVYYVEIAIEGRKSLREQLILK